MKGNTKLVLLGTRGSVPVGGPDFLKYGGDSSCVLVLMGGQTIILDAGSGLLRSMPYLGENRDIHIFLTHIHIDHVLGLPCYQPLYNADYRVHIHLPQRDDLTARQQVEAFMATPLWPTGTEVFSPNVTFESIDSFPLHVGPVRIDGLRGNHPGGSMIYRLSDEAGSVVFCTDFEHTDHHLARLEQFAAGASLLLYDSQYTPEEYLGKTGWGHSVWRVGAELGQRSGVGRVVFTHHDPFRTDRQLDQLAEECRAHYPMCSFGRCGEELSL